MNKAITYGTMMAATITLLACQRNGGELGEADRTVQILSTVSYDKMSKGLVAQATPLASVRFLQANGTAVPASMTGSTPFEGNRAIDGTIAWTGTAPTYNKLDQNSYFVAYHPATGTGAVETADTKVDWTVDGKTDLLLSAPYDAGKYSAPKTGSNAGETPLTFHHVLAQLEVVFQAESNTSLDMVRELYGKIKEVRFGQALPTATYTYATNKTTFSGTKADIALWQADCETAFAPIAVPASDNKAANAAGLFAPVAGSFTLWIMTEQWNPLSVVVQLVDAAGGSVDFAAGKKHTITLQLKAKEKKIVVLGTEISAWGVGGGSESDIDIEVHPPTASDYIEIDGLKWAKGNLVATGNHGCRVGAPTDYGVYFQFGSLVGWTGGKSGNGEGTGSPGLNQVVWPTEMGATKPTYSWQNKNAAGTSTLEHYYFNYSMAPWETANILSDIGSFAVPVAKQAAMSGTLRGRRYANLGVGDPCTYYLGAPWRTPAAYEYTNLLGVDGANANIGIPLKLKNYDLSFPAAGFRANTDGGFSQVGKRSGYWSSSVSGASNGYSIYYRGDAPQVRHNSVEDRALGFLVRCVAGDVPYIEINGLKWAKGNLVASGNNSCKIGAPTDYGLYFQFGSLVGWTGGSGDGTGTGSPGLGVKVKPATYGGESDWGTVGRYKEGTTPDKGSNLPGTDAPTTGIGDPCRYYLGAPWRTPTATEHLSLLGDGGTNTNKGKPLKLKDYDLSFPPAGYRASADGGFLRIHNRGGFWSSSIVDATKGYYMYFFGDLGTVLPNDSDVRSVGVPVRCVAD